MTDMEKYAPSRGLQTQISMQFVLEVCISQADAAARTDIFRLIKCHELPVVRINNGTKTRFPLHASNHSLRVEQVWKTDSWTDHRTANW